MLYGTKNANQYEGDVVIQRGTTTYVCKLMPGYYRGTNDLPVTQQAVWQIQRATQRIVEATGNDEDTMFTELMFPNGCEDYKFIMEDFDKYTYDFRH